MPLRTWRVFPSTGWVPSSPGALRGSSGSICAPGPPQSSMLPVGASGTGAVPLASPLEEGTVACFFGQREKGSCLGTRCPHIRSGFMASVNPCSYVSYPCSLLCAGTLVGSCPCPGVPQSGVVLYRVKRYPGATRGQGTLPQGYWGSPHPTSPCWGSDGQKEGCGRGRERGGGSTPMHEVCVCVQLRAGNMAKHVAGGRQPLSLCLGERLGLLPTAARWLRDGAGALSPEEVFLLEGLAQPPRADARCYDNRRRLLCASGAGEEGKGNGWWRRRA